MNRGWIVELVQRLPAAAISRAWGHLVRRRRPRVAVELAKRAFVFASGADLSEAAEPIGAFATVEELFVRRLREGARPIDDAPEAVVSPVDAAVGACGTVESGTLLQVKGRHYTLAKLLDDADEAARYEGGPYATFYLAPRDYHRIHAPVSGTVAEATLIPGRLLPVFSESLERVDELFAKNERLVTYIDSPEAGRVAVVKVGATMVGRIGVAYDPTARTNVAGASSRRLRYEPPHPVSRGGDLGVFELGSTVVLVGERGRLALDEVTPGTFVRVGMRIGTQQGSVQARGAVERRSTPARKAAASPRRRPRKRGA